MKRDVLVDSTFHQASLPTAKIAQMQSDWLEGARARLLRQAGIQHSTAILDLGCGWGQTTLDLAARCDAQFTGIDCNRHAIEAAKQSVPPTLCNRINFVHADAAELPFESASYDIIFSQYSFLWIQKKERTLQECRRVLKPSGKLVLIEPDYGGMMEYPPQVSCRELWMEMISQAGGDPIIGRSLNVLCRLAGFDCQSYLLDRYLPPHPSYLDFLKELPTTDQQTQRIQEVITAQQGLGSSGFTVHLPIWMVIAKLRLDSTGN